RIRQRSRTMQFIILTGFGNLDFARRAIRVEAADFLIKPCRMDELESSIQRTDGYVASDPESNQASTSSECKVGSENPATSVESIEQAERRLILAALARHNGS